MSSAGLSNVGHGAFYSDGDQRTAPKSEQDTRSKFEQGQMQSHQNLDSSRFPFSVTVVVSANRTQRTNARLATVWPLSKTQKTRISPLRTEKTPRLN